MPKSFIHLTLLNKISTVKLNQLRSIIKEELKNSLNEYQDKSQFKSILTVKVDGHPWILKGGFSREKMLDIVDDIKKIQGVKAFHIKDDNISAL